MLDKLREMAGPEANVLESDADGDTIVIGPNSDYRAEVLKDGDLGDNDVFKDVVREADKAQTVLFVNVDEFEDAIADAAGRQRRGVHRQPEAGLRVRGHRLGRRRHRARGAAAHDRLMSATIAPVTSMRSAGAISTSRPRRPPET